MLTMAAMAAMVGCESTPAVDNTGGNTDEPGTGGGQTETTTVSITATLATALINSDEATSRVAIEEASDIAAKLLWSKGDVINLFDVEGKAVEYKTSTSGTSSKATFKGNEVEMESAWALYSSSEATVDYEAKTIATTIAAEQTYDPADEFGIETGVLAAVAVGDKDNEEFAFKSVAGVFAMNLTGSGIVKSIEVKAADSEKIAGDVVISMDGTPAISSATESAVTLSCGDGVELGAVAKNFSVVVAPTTSALSFTVTLNDDTTVEFTSAEGVGRNEITKCTAQVGEAGTDDPDGPDGPADSKNLMTNGDFESDEVSSVTGASGTSTERIVDGSTEPIFGNATKFLESTNPTAQTDTNNAWHARITFLFDEPLKTGEQYKLTFRACSDKTDMVLNDASLSSLEDYNTGTDKVSFNLTTEWKEYSVVIDENLGWWNSYKFSGSDYKFGLNFGMIEGKVYIDDVVIEKVEGTTPPAGSGAFINGDFETGEIDSSVDGYSENTSCELVDGSVNPVDGNETFFLKATNNGDGSNGMGARINFHLPSPLAADSEYLLTFKACTDIDAVVLKELGLWGNGGWLTGTFMSEFTLDKTWKEVSFKIEKKGWWNEDLFAGADMIEFRFGTYAGASLYIDDAVLSIPEPPVVTPGNEIMSDPGLDKMWVNANNAGTEGLYVGTEDTDGNKYGSVAKATGADGGAALKIISDNDLVTSPDDSHRIHVQIKPGECGTGFSVFEKGKKYKVSFDLKSDGATQILAQNAIIQDASWANYPSFTGDENIVTTTEWQTFSYDIIPDDENGYAGACYIVLQLAYYSDAFYIDNISLKEME